MTNKIVEYLQKTVAITLEEAEQFASMFKEVKVKKRQFIVQPNFIVKNKNFVLSGAFRAYVMDDNGQDSTISFAIEDWWITDYNSYILQKPATMFVVALVRKKFLKLCCPLVQLQTLLLVFAKCSYCSLLSTNLQLQKIWCCLVHCHP